MKIKISYERARTGFPEAVKEAVAKLRKGRSKHRNAAPADLRWSLSWGVRIEGGAFSFKDLLDGTARARAAARRAMTVEERIADEVRRVFASVEAAIPTGHCYYGGAPLTPVPDEIVRYITERKTEIYREEQREERRVAAMSDEERAAEAEQLLNKLRGTPGFVEVNL